MDKGIFLVAFGKPGYAYAAYNLLLSIKHFNKDLPVALLCNDQIKYALGKDINRFDHVIDIKREHYLTNGKIDPGKAKVNIYEYLPFKNNLYLDIDAVGLQDIEPLLDQLISTDKFYVTQVVDKGGKKDKIDYNYWATNEAEWEIFDLKDDAVFPAIQSSFCFVKKCKEAKSFFNKVKKNFDKFPKEKLLNTWGGTIPDELIFSGTLAQNGIDASFKVNGKIIEPIFFGNRFTSLQLHELSERFYLLSIYGNGDVGRTLTKLMYLKHYDRLLERKYCSALGIAHRYKIEYIMRDKHANIKK